MRNIIATLLPSVITSFLLAGCPESRLPEPIGGIVPPGEEEDPAADPAWPLPEEDAVDDSTAAPVPTGSAGADLQPPLAPDATEPAAPPPAPCIATNPTSVDFGAKKLGEQAVGPFEIVNCGWVDLEIYSLEIKEGSSPDFSLDLSMLDHVPAVDSPIAIPALGKVWINVVFTPGERSPMVDGELLLDTGTLVITSSAAGPEKEVPLSGGSICMCCPTAVIKCTEGDEVIPQTVLHLYGDESYADNGGIGKWEWDVDQPAGSQSVFVPSCTFPNPTFEANVAGVYTFYLTVYDQLNTPSCFPAAYQVVVMPDVAIHVELLWFTPEDPDETDTGPEAGSDVDLHFAHPWAAGPDIDGDGKPDGWFHMPFDCFWFNAHPAWGSYDPNIDDDPHLDRDDTDGAGPENVNFNIPENVTYKVGVNYWNDHGYGTAYVTVRVYIYAQLVFEMANVPLGPCDMWEVCTVTWPSGQVKPVLNEDDEPKITPGYTNPYFAEGNCW